MIYQLRNPHFYMVLAGDIIIFCLSLFLAYLIRFEFRLTQIEIDQLMLFLPLTVGIKAAVFFLMKAYRGMFRYTSLPDILLLMKATVISTFGIIFVVLVVFRFQGFSRAVFILDGGLTFLLLGGFRLMIRVAFHNYEKGRSNGHPNTKPLMAIHANGSVSVLIIGAGSTGEKILRELNENPRLNYRVVGFVDDDPMKMRRSIHGVPVLGHIRDLPGLVKTFHVRELLIATPSASGAQMRGIVDICERIGITYKTMPGLGELIDGKVSVNALREVNYRDLLRREPVQLDVQGIEECIKNKRILVTGAGGSIGSELCRQIVRFLPEELILFDASESNLYNIQMELKHRAGYQKYATILGTVQDEHLVDQAFCKYKPHVVFHAAAYKHVPILERNPWQAVINNITACRIILEHSIKHHVNRFVLVSTDKAVRPTNVMGASKRICELLMSAYAHNGTCMVAVRFGNVVGSAGSVIPLFRDQISRGGPVTVTHPQVTRFFMTIPEACQLILQAAVLGQGGELFVLKMGTPVKIADMARDLIRLSGKDPDHDIEIVYTGLRQGEKLYEELITEDENFVETAHDKIMVLMTNNHWNGKVNQNGYRQWLLGNLTALNTMAAQHDACAIRQKLCEIVPEYAVQDSKCVL